MNQKPHLIFLGAPGSGKGTQSSILMKNFSYRHVSTGNLLRAEVKKESELGKVVQSVIESGKLVSDDLMVDVIKSNTNLDESSYIFDGYPRNKDQAETLNSILNGKKFVAVYFEMNTDILVERLTNRRVSPDGRYIYNLVTNPPKVDGVCDVTGEKLVHRKDDQENVIRDRMSLFTSTIDPILKHYDDSGSLVRLDASKSLELVTQELEKIVNKF